MTISLDNIFCGFLIAVAWIFSWGIFTIASTHLYLRLELTINGKLRKHGKSEALIDGYTGKVFTAYCVIMTILTMSSIIAIAIYCLIASSLTIGISFIISILVAATFYAIVY